MPSPLLADGGRLERELRYVDEHLGAGSGATNEMVIQTPFYESASILSSDALLTHLRVLKTASRVVVEKGDT